MDLSTGEFFNRPTIRVRNDLLELECLAEAGPRVVRLRYRGGENLFAEVPDRTRSTPFGEYHYFGGHRLWHAPEGMPRTYYPENGGASAEPLPDGVRLLGAPDLASGIRKAMTLQLHPREARATISHLLTNENPWEVTLAPWGITMFRMGGVAILPTRIEGQAKEGLLPDQRIVVWPYASITDPRVRLCEASLEITATPAPPFKIAAFNPCGWLTYRAAGVAFTKSFPVPQGGEFPDLGSNAEIYCDEDFIELESLGPLARLSPQGSLSWTEEWDVGPLEN